MNLVKVKNTYSVKKIYLEKKTYKNLKKLINKLQRKKLGKITIISGYMPLYYQIWHYTKVYHYLKNKTKYFVLYPIQSLGQTFTLNFSNSSIYKEFLREMPNYGFILRYPLDKFKVTKMFGRNNYFFYVGKIAKVINKYHLAYEEYTTFF